MTNLRLEVGQHLNVLVPYADRFIPCEAEVLTSAGRMLTITPPERHRVKVPLHSDHIVVKVPRSDALYELRCPTEQVEANMWAVTLPGKDGTTRIQRRQFVRVSMTHSARLLPEVPQGAPKARSIPCEIVDLSGGGCAVRTEQPLKVGTYLSVVCNLLADSAPQRLKGRVVRSTQREDSTVLAIEFRGLGLPLQNALVHLVQTYDLGRKQPGATAAPVNTTQGGPEPGGKRYDRSRFTYWSRS